MKVAHVIVDVPTSRVNQSFDYHIPKRFQEVLSVGMRVIIPFGPRKIMGFVIELSEQSAYHHLKDIDDVLDLTPVLTKELIELGEWLAHDTLSLYITAYQAMLPQVLKAKYKKELVRETESNLPEQLETLFAGRDIVAYEEFAGSIVPYSQLQKAIQTGDVSINYLVKSNVTKKRLTVIKATKEPYLLEEVLLDLPTNATKQRLVIEYFIDHPLEIEQKKLLEMVQTTQSTLKTLLDKQLLTSRQVEVYRNPYQNMAVEKTYPLDLTTEQRHAIEPIKQRLAQQEHDVFLLHGVTGSGKTEIYLQVIQKVIEKGQEAIMLVPEISLTPQMVRRFKSRFGSNVAVMHSALSKGEKYDEWRKIHRKEVQVVVGARSAVFAPFENIGVIIIDEEHENSYKQEEQPRYHARDVAIKRGKYFQCPVILGSATPTLESYARAQKGVYSLATLTKRTNDRAMPQVNIVDMREELHAGNRTMFSKQLKEKIEEAIAKKEQVVLLLNRRGYSTFVMCRDCGHVKECPYCDIALTYHKRYHKLKCHYCSYEEPMPQVCPECQSPSIRYFGTGTQRVEEALIQLIPQARVIRMDVDTTKRKGSHERILRQFARGGADILLGTQMIAKGLDFENVTLVGVLSADSMLHLPDFRSSEKTFQLLTQVSGRAGRHQLPGKVIVQTYTPEHYSIRLASQYDYQHFFQYEMKLRKTFRYPPYVFLGLITVSHENQVKVNQVIQQIVQLLSQVVKDETIILGPTPSPIARIKSRYRYQCLLKYKNEPHLRKYLNKILDHFNKEMQTEDLKIIVDLQPYHLM